MNDNSAKRLIWALILTGIIFVAEVIGGMVSNSLALLSDAGHVLTDLFSLGLSLLAVFVMRKPSDFRATYGYQRIGLLIALINGVSLVVMALFIFVETYRRFQSPPEVNPSIMLVVAVGGLAGNLLMVRIMSGGHKDLNIRSAWLHVVGDALSSAGVIVAGVIIMLTSWGPADPIASGIVGLLIVLGGWRVIKEALWIFLELSPKGFRVEDVSQTIAEIPGVQGVHDVHIWSIGHGLPAFSAHVVVSDQKISDIDAIRAEIEHELLHRGIKHTVIQMESLECAENGLFCKLKELSDTHHHH